MTWRDYQRNRDVLEVQHKYKREAGKFKHLYDLKFGRELELVISSS